MPKRPVTPPTNAPYKYFTVQYAYPGEPNLDLLAHRKEVAFWISNALGNSQDLIAIYYKPTVRLSSRDVQLIASDVTDVHSNVSFTRHSQL